MLFGAHVSSAGGIDTAIDRIEKIGGDCVQVFTQSPRMWRPTNHKPEAIERFKARRDQAGIRGVVFHVGSHLGAGMDVGIKRVVPALKELLELSTDTTWLLLENSAGAGGTIGRSLDELVTLFDAAGGHERLGLCIDTCHLYVSGVDVTAPATVAGLVREIEESVGLDRLRALHVNDAAAPLGSNRDRHANILEGEIGEGMGAFLAHPAFQHLSAYLEVPGVDRQGVSAEELKKVRDLHARWTR